MSRVLEHEPAFWHAHTYLYKFTAEDERATMHALHPWRARLVEQASRKGYRLPRGTVPHIPGESMRALGIEPYAIEEDDGNVLCSGGINKLELLMVGTPNVVAFNNANSGVLVGDGGGQVPNPASSDTDLVALISPTSRWGQVSDPTFPAVINTIVTWQATYGTSNANFHWMEWGIDSRNSSGATTASSPLLNHKGIDLGTKNSASAWAFRVTVQIS